MRCSTGYSFGGGKQGSNTNLMAANAVGTEGENPAAQEEEISNMCLIQHLSKSVGGLGARLKEQADVIEKLQGDQALLSQELERERSKSEDLGQECVNLRAALKEGALLSTSSPASHRLTWQ